MYKSTRALILRETKYKESDKILTVLTEDEGKKTVSARGVMSKNSKLAAGCQLLAFSDMVFYERMGKLYVKEAQTIEQFLGLRQDIALLALGVYFAELLETVSDEDSPNSAVLRLGLNSLFALSKELYSQKHIKAIFELKLMCLSGYEPMLDCCVECGEDTFETQFFSTSGGILCSKCRFSQYGQVFPLSESVLRAMRYVTSAEEKKIFSFFIDEAAERQLAQICEEYVTAQLERRFSSLDYWKSVS